MINADVNKLKAEEREVIQFFKNQIKTLTELKRACEKVQWNDQLYDSFVLTITEINRTFVDMLQTLTNGTDVYLISEFIPYLKEYLKFAKKFPIL